MTRLVPLALLLALLPTGRASAQEHVHDAMSEHEHQEGHAGLVASVAPLFEMVKGYIVAAAEEMPEDKYSYQPVPEVRSFGQILGHVANAQYMFCHAVTGKEGGPPENFEERTTKAGLVEAVKMAFAACDAAYALDDARVMEEMQFFGQTGSRLWVLNFNVAHNWEHYGNLVTYLRANGLVPPSSQGGGM